MIIKVTEETIKPIDEPEIRKEKHRAWQRAYMRNWHLKKNYGITKIQFDAILRKQRFACAICGSTHTGSKDDWHVDHNHSTKEVRGLLCHHCNVGLGGFHDNVKVMKMAIKYLKGS